MRIEPMRWMEEVAWILVLSLLTVTAVARLRAANRPAPGPPAIQQKGQPSKVRPLRTRNGAYYAQVTTTSRTTEPSALCATTPGARGTSSPSA